MLEIIFEWGSKTFEYLNFTKLDNKFFRID